MNVWILLACLCAIVPSNSAKEEELPFEIGESLVHGKGAFATKNISSGEKIWVGAILSWTSEVTEEFGRWVNHCGKRPSAVFGPQVEEDGKMWFRALRDIGPGEEITCDYDDPGTAWLLVKSRPNYVEC